MVVSELQNSENTIPTLLWTPTFEIFLDASDMHKPQQLNIAEYYLHLTLTYEIL
jgi:hypothetical protein